MFKNSFHHTSYNFKIFTSLWCYAALVVVTDNSGQPISPIFKGQAISSALRLEMNRMVVPEHHWLNTNQHYIKSQKGEDLVYSTAEAWYAQLEYY
jgi:hypothetical protein